MTHAESEVFRVAGREAVIVVAMELVEGEDRAVNVTKRAVHPNARVGERLELVSRRVLTRAEVHVLAVAAGEVREDARQHRLERVVRIARGMRSAGTKRTLRSCLPCMDRTELVL